MRMQMRVKIATKPSTCLLERPMAKEKNWRRLANRLA